MKIFMSVMLFFNILFADLYNDGIHEYKKGNETKALEFLMKYCNNTHGLFCLSIGDMFLRGKKVKQNLNYAKKFYKKSCEKNIIDGCVSEAIIYFKESNFEKALKISQKSCSNDSAPGCYLVAKIYKESDSKLYFEFLEKACKMKNYKACYELGILYSQGLKNVVKRNFKKSFNLFNKVCLNSNFKEACGMKGIFYYEGVGVKKDLFKAELILKDLCEKKDNVACTQLNIMNEKYKTKKNKNYLESKEKFIKEQIINGYVKDIRTNLTWQDNKNVNKNKFNLKEARNYCNNLKLGGFNNWALPSQKELLTLINKNKSTNTVSIIQNSPSGIYWTNTSYFKSNIKVGIDFTSAKKVKLNGDLLNFVRCVRKGN